MVPHTFSISYRLRHCHLTSPRKYVVLLLTSNAPVGQVRVREECPRKSNSVIGLAEVALSEVFLLVESVVGDQNAGEPLADEPVWCHCQRRERKVRGNPRNTSIGEGGGVASLEFSLFECFFVSSKITDGCIQLRMVTLYMSVGLLWSSSSLSKGGSAGRRLKRVSRRVRGDIFWQVSPCPEPQLACISKGPQLITPEFEANRREESYKNQPISNGSEFIYSFIHLFQSGGRKLCGDRISNICLKTLLLVLC